MLTGPTRRISLAILAAIVAAPTVAASTQADAHASSCTPAHLTSALKAGRGRMRLGQSHLGAPAGRAHPRHQPYLAARALRRHARRARRGILGSRLRALGACARPTTRSSPMDRPATSISAPIAGATARRCRSPQCGERARSGAAERGRALCLRDSGRACARPAFSRQVSRMAGATRAWSNDRELVKRRRCRGCFRAAPGRARGVKATRRARARRGSGRQTRTVGPTPTGRTRAGRAAARKPPTHSAAARARLPDSGRSRGVPARLAQPGRLG